MAATTKRARATIVTQSSIEDAQSFLQTLPDKPKEDLSLKEAVEKLKVPLQAALAKGYTYPELAALLKDKGIKISAATLKNYIPTGKRRGKGQSQTTKTRKQAAKQVQPETASTLETPQDLPDPSSAWEPTSATTPKRRGRATTKTETTRSPKETAKAATNESSENSAAKTPPRSHRGAAKTRTSSNQTTKSTTSQRTSAAPRSKSSRTRKTGTAEA
ncbi:MAG: hypothetical protein NW224_10550 [Leptolyngbyaceae cyanobacterium bins.302]|nr:hypothetical protein [Leptolyngbyaceae cyanobacterium bins.302]